jgi:hypothetical protein
MDIEDLSKAQLLLLTVMVNFVVSIATGILTVSLLDRAPVQVSQGVDRIVEHTIQTIATPIQVVNPIKSITSSPAAPSTEQLMTAAVGDDAARTILIYRDSTTTPAIAFGTFLPKSRAVVTVTVDGLPKEAVVAFSDGSSQHVSLSKSTASLSIYGFADGATLPQVPDAGLLASSKLKQGQSVLSLTKDSAAITGIISKVGLTTIETNLVGVPVGAGVVDLNGHVVGIGGLGAGIIVPADTINALLQAPAAK